jgi:hypothetical protein
VTSPPYWRKRDYEVAGQIGQEATPGEYVDALTACLSEWRRVLRPTGSVFLNIGDTFRGRSLVGIPARVESAAIDAGWSLRNRIVWAKRGGMPDPSRNRLAPRHEYVLHFVADARRYFYDLHGYASDVGNGANPGDVWNIALDRHMGPHLAPFPAELARRAIVLACPAEVCTTCGEPRRRIERRTRDLDPTRPQAVRAMQLARNLSDAHIAAIQAHGITDAGKARRTQDGTDRQAGAVKALAAEAKEVLGGYFREFMFAQRVTVGWSSCGHATFAAGLVLDPFVGTGTTMRVASEMRRRSIGVDLLPA